MIAGLGHDLVEVQRVVRAITRQPRLVKRILTPVEQEKAEGLSPGALARLVAKRFAAKEAVGKALGLGLRAPMGLQEMSVDHTELGQPYVIPHGHLQQHLNQHRLCLHLSISDERLYVSATAIAERYS